jgi:hypothetical protein
MHYILFFKICIFNMSKIPFLVILFSFAFITSNIAQEETKEVNYCGLKDYTISTWLREFQANPGAYAHLRGNNDLLQIPLTIHIIGQNNGNGYFTLPELMNSLCVLNEMFEPVNIQFFIKGNIRYHNNTAWYDHATFQTGSAMFNITRVVNTINCYIDNNAAGNCGYAYLGGFGMFLKKSCIRGNNSTWAHEMGHSLSLPHTFYGWENTTYQTGDKAPNTLFYNNINVQVERVDRSNCVVAADGFCDTPQDFLSFIWPCGSNRVSTVLQTDPNGDNFRSDGNYIMSYSNCSDIFADDQMAAMRAHTLSQKSSFIDNSTLPMLSTRKTNNRFPNENQEVHYQNIRLEWDPVTNAEGYIVQVQRASPPITQLEEYVQTNSFVVPSLVENRDYVFRVMPISKTDFCVEYSDPTRFRAVLETSTVDLEGSSFRVYPSMLSAGNQTLTLEGTLNNSMDLNLQVIDLSGKILKNESRFLTSGYFRETLNMENLQPGVYLLRGNSGRSISTIKFIVQ